MDKKFDEIEKKNHDVEFKIVSPNKEQYKSLVFDWTKVKGKEKSPKEKDSFMNSKITP